MPTTSRPARAPRPETRSPTPPSAITVPASSSPTCAFTSTTTSASSCTCWSSSTRARPRRPQRCSRKPRGARWRSPRWLRSRVRLLRLATRSTDPARVGLDRDQCQGYRDGRRELVYHEEQQVEGGGEHEREQPGTQLAGAIAGQHRAEQGGHEHVSVAHVDRAEGLGLELGKPS